MTLDFYYFFLSSKFQIITVLSEDPEDPEIMNLLSLVKAILFTDKAWFLNTTTCVFSKTFHTLTVLSKDLYISDPDHEITNRLSLVIAMQFTLSK